MRLSTRLSLLLMAALPQWLCAQTAVSQDATQTQMQLWLNDGTAKYYNTQSVGEVTVNAGTVTVGNDTYTNQLSTITFTKAISQPVSITESKGWLESAYVKFDLLPNINRYNVYVKGGQYANYTLIDRQLVRSYGTYGRADVVGLKAAADYHMKVVPVNGDGTELTQFAAETAALDVKAYDRCGFAHFNYTSGVGAYTDEGTLKPNAVVIYVTAATAKTVSATLSSGEFTGLQAILTAYEKGNVNTPLAVRIVGCIDKDDMDAIG